MEFGKLSIQKQVFKRESTAGSTRGQDFKEIKFRRWVSKKKEHEGEVDEELTFANELFDRLGLKDLALAQAEDDETNSVLLLVVEDQKKVEPKARLFVQQRKQDGTHLEKGRKLTSPFLIEALIKRGVLDGETKKNQYLALENVVGNYPGAPSVVKGIYKVVVDSSIKEEEEEVAEQSSVAKDNF